MGFESFTNNQQYNDNILQWDINHDCLIDAIKRKGKTYLPSNELPASALSNQANVQLNNYMQNIYKTRILPMAVFYNFTNSTQAGWVGTITGKPATVEFSEEGTDSIIDYLKWNADGAGGGVDQLAKRAIETTTAYGGGLFLVVPPEENTTPISIKDGSIATRIKCFDRRHILDWRYDYVKSARQLTYLKLIDGRLSRDGENWKEEVRFIEYELIDELCFFSIKTEKEDGFEEIVSNSALTKDGKQATSIPAHAFGSMINSLDGNAAPINVIANKNIEHYQMSSRHQQQCWDAGQGQYHIDLGDTKNQQIIHDAENNPVNPLEFLNPGGIKLGSMMPVVTSNGGTVTLMQITTDNLLAQEPARLELQAQKLGAIMMSEQADVTATAARISASGMMAQLLTISANVSRSLTSAIEEAAEYSGYIYEGIKYELSRDLVDAVYTSLDKSADLALVESGRMPVKAYFEKLKRMGELPESMTYDEYKQEIEDDLADASLGGVLPSFGNSAVEE